MVVKNAERMVVDTALKMGYIKLVNTFIGFDMREKRYRPIPVVSLPVSDILCINRNLMLLDNTVRQCTEAVLETFKDGNIVPASDFLLMSVVNVTEEDGVAVTLVPTYLNRQAESQYSSYYNYNGANFTEDDDGPNFVNSSNYNMLIETLYLGMNEYYNLCRAGHYTHYTSLNAMPKGWIEDNYESSPEPMNKALSDPINSTYMITHPGFMEDAAVSYDSKGFYPREIAPNQYYHVIPEMKDQAKGQLLEIVSRVPIPQVQPPQEVQSQVEVNHEKDWVAKGIKMGADGKPEALVIENTKTGEVKLITP